MLLFILRRLIILGFCGILLSSASGFVCMQAQEAGERYFIDVNRYRFSWPDMNHSAFYPVPNHDLSRDLYLRSIEAADPATIASQPARGMDGPRIFLPVLVKLVQTGDPSWGEAIRKMFEAFTRDLERTVEDRGWFWRFEQPAALIPLYRHFLLKEGIIEPDTPWFRTMWLYYCRHLHVWDSEPIEWRGGCHRSMPEGVSKYLAAQWYPDIPEASHWKEYGQWVFDDFWHTKDAPQNDTGYMMGPIIILACVGDQWTGDDRVFTDPGMKRLWDRLLVEITPDGAVNPYGPNGGWNSTADYRIALMERLAAKTGRSDYRFAAQKMLNYLIYQSPTDDPMAVHPGYGHTWHLALAWLFADESLPITTPDSGSTWTKRMEAVRVPHTDKALTEKLIGHADPRENHGHICCSWHMSGKEWPDKLILRSGWNPGDFFALVELHPTSFPANPGGIMGMNRWGSPFTQIVTSKGASVENRLQIEDLSGSIPKRYHPDALRINEFWQAGKMPNIQSRVTDFEDHELWTYARVEVDNMDGLPISYARSFLFIKNRFLVSRETVTFEASFKARIGPLWNTQNIGPQIGSSWANTFMSYPVADNGRRSAPTPAVDLLVWFAPHDERHLQSINRLETDPRAQACPNQLRYTWEGTSTVGQSMVFTSLYYPHLPYRPDKVSNNPSQGQATAAWRNQREATAHASGIEVIEDSIDQTLLSLELEEGNREWVWFNPTNKSMELNGNKIQSRFGYLKASKP